MTQARALRTRERLVAAARDIVAVDGFAALRTETVVLRAGTAKGTFFTHFPDKDHLLAVLAAERMNACTNALPPPHDPGWTVEAVIDALHRMFHVFLSDHAILSLVPQFSNSDTYGYGLYEAISTFLSHFGRTIAGLQKANAVRRDLPADLLAEALLSFCFTSACSAYCTNHAPEGVAQVLERLDRMTIGWLLPPP